MVEGRGGSDHGRVKGWAYRDAAGFQRLIDRITAATIAYLSRQVAAGAEVVQLFDSWAGSLDADQFARWVVAPIRAITAAVRTAHPGLPIIAFPRQAGANLDGFVDATGVQGVSIDGAVPLNWAARMIHPRAAIQGNLDSRLVVVGGEALDTGIARCCAELGRGPYIFNLGHGIVPETPPEHVAQLVATVRRQPDPRRGGG
jgi:uroporphyrinogen decarboxylase